MPLDEKIGLGPPIDEKLRANADESRAEVGDRALATVPAESVEEWLPPFLPATGFTPAVAPVEHRRLRRAGAPAPFHARTEPHLAGKIESHVYSQPVFRRHWID